MQTNVSDLLVEAGSLLLAGMSVVFIFLTLLIGAINLIAHICAKFPDKEPETLARGGFKSKPATKTGDVAPETVAAIGAAIHQYRNSH